MKRFFSHTTLCPFSTLHWHPGHSIPQLDFESILIFLGCNDPPRYNNAQCTPFTGPYPIGSTVTCRCTVDPNCPTVGGGDNCYTCSTPPRRERGQDLILRCTEQSTWIQVQPFPSQPPLPPLLPLNPFCDRCTPGQPGQCKFALPFSFTLKSSRKNVDSAAVCVKVYPSLNAMFLTRRSF